MYANLGDIDLDTLEEIIGADCFEAALGYIRRQAVLSQWTVGEDELWGMVQGSYGEFYTPTVYFSAQPPTLTIRGSKCNCHARRGCEHAAALLIYAVQAAGDGTAAFAVPAHPPAWDTSLTSLLTPASSGQTTALAIELSLTVAQPHPRTTGLPQAGLPPVRLMAKLVQPGKNGGWLGGSLSWGRLESYGLRDGYSEPQVRLLREILALYRTRNSSVGYRRHSYADERAIELTAFESGRLWPLLDEAAEIGLSLVYAHDRGPVERYRSAELCLDITRAEPGGPLAIVPVIRLDEGTPEPVVPVRFIGPDGHGLVYLGPGEARTGVDPAFWRFRLARLDRPAPAALQRMALAGQRLEVPRPEQDRFRDEFYPRLRQMATLISSDGSFTPPVVSAPTLVLCASYGTEHQLEVSWMWEYRIDDIAVRAGLEPTLDDAGYRDAQAEQAILDNLPANRSLSPRHQPRARLAGLDTARFSTELLPLLDGQSGVTVEVTGAPADYREVGDSLRIDVSAQELAEDNDWFGLEVKIKVEGREVPFGYVFTALSRGQAYLLLRDGAYFCLDKPELRQLAALIEESRALQDAPRDELRISRFQAGLWEELAALGVVSYQAEKWQRQVQGLLAGGRPGGVAPPETLQARLRGYQLDGFGWLAFLWEYRLGGILADDMGLGKTLEALALICHARHAEPGGAPFLIVAPTSVVPNWAAEAARFAPGLRVVTITDTLARRGADLGELIAGADAVVTSYTLLRLNFDAHVAASWSGLILDEAQSVKNHQSKTHQCARRLRAPFKVAITGTPMENNLMELWSLLSITAPGLFPNPRRFRDYYAHPIEKQGHTERLAQLRRRIRPLVKRRTKDQVAADLPAKQEQVLEVELHPRHRRLYQLHLQRERQKVLGLIGDVDAHRFAILRSLTLLRQLSLHAALVDSDQQEMPCSKIDTLLAQVQDVIAGGHRALVFSQFTRFLGHVRDRFDAAGIRYRYLDGKTQDRAGEIRRFKDGTDPVFLISLKAGGFGLNLAEADYCFLLDPWWNPAAEAQAVDRAHRIGQIRNVMVYRLIAKDTIEEKVMALQARKAALFANVIDAGNMFGASLDADDIRALFT
jgi:superfamily II DNA or RNA helicase